MSLKRQGNFFPLPGGEVTAVGPDGSTRVYEDFGSRNSMTDASYVHGGPNAFGYGAFNREREAGPWCEERGNADTTSATPRPRPKFGSIG